MTDAPTVTENGEGVQQQDPADLEAVRQEQQLFQQNQMDYLVGRAAYLRKYAGQLEAQLAEAKARITELEQTQTD